MLYDVASLISIISEAITLEAGDVIVSGTPAGIGWAREPKLICVTATSVRWRSKVWACCQPRDRRTAASLNYLL